MLGVCGSRFTAKGIIFCSSAESHHSLVACSSPKGLRPRSWEPGLLLLSATRRSSASSITAPRVGVLMALVLRCGGSENGDWSLDGDSVPMGIAPVLSLEEADANEVDETLASDLAAISILFNPLPSLTTWARPCCAVFALFRYVEPTLKLLALLSGRPAPNFWKSMAGTGGVLGALRPADLTLTTVGLARIPV